jgi:hypothetical protein
LGALVRGDTGESWAVKWRMQSSPLRPRCFGAFAILYGVRFEAGLNARLTTTAVDREECAPDPLNGGALRMHASHQNHGNEYKCRSHQRKIWDFCCDIRKQVVLYHDLFLKKFHLIL